MENKAMKLHVDYDWSVRKLAESPDNDDCEAGVPLEVLTCPYGQIGCLGGPACVCAIPVEQAPES